MSWVASRVARRVSWDEGVWSLTLADGIDEHKPGQWTNLALEVDGERVRRPYSIASPPGQPPEFLLVSVAGGALSPRLCALAQGDEVWVERQPRGFFTLDEVPTAPCLWLLATGTGLGPFMAMLGSPEQLLRFEQVVVVHGVRYGAQLAYRDRLTRLAEATAEAGRPRIRYLPLVTGEDVAGIQRARLTSLMRDGELARAAGAQLSAESAHVMLCGNPAMVSEATELLGERGMRKHRRRRPGHITTEAYW